MRRAAAGPLGEECCPRCFQLVKVQVGLCSELFGYLNVKSFSLCLENIKPIKINMLNVYPSHEK